MPIVQRLQPASFSDTDFCPLKIAIDTLALFIMRLYVNILFYHCLTIYCITLSAYLLNVR